MHTRMTSSRMLDKNIFIKSICPKQHFPVIDGAGLCQSLLHI